MIVGADVTHSSKDSVAPSVAGLVATCDGESNQYLASARLQSNKTEVCNTCRMFCDEVIF